MGYDANAERLLRSVQDPGKNPKVDPAKPSASATDGEGPRSDQSKVYIGGHSCEEATDRGAVPPATSTPCTAPTTIRSGHWIAVGLAIFACFVWERIVEVN